MILRIIAGSMLALGLGLMAENVQAAQTFICDDGRVIRAWPRGRPMAMSETCALMQPRRWPVAG